MTARSNRPVSKAVVCAASGGAGTTRVAVPLATLTQPGRRGGHRVLVGFEGDAFGVLSRPPAQPPGWAAARRSRVGADCGGS